VSCGSDCPQPQVNKKTHDRFQPWVLVEMFASRSTSANGAVPYDDDQQQADLSNIL